MAKKAAGLSALAVKNMKTPGLYADGGGLYLQVTATGAKTWIFRFVSPTTKKRRDMGLGPVADILLADARERASDARRLVANGADPIEVKRAQKTEQAPPPPTSAPTFKVIAKSYIEANASRWKSAKHAAQWESTLERYAYPSLGNISVSDIGIDEVLKVLEPIWSTKTETASRLRGRIESVLDAARVKGHRSGPNPAAWGGNLQHILPSPDSIAPVEHHAAMPSSDLPEFWPKLQAHDGMGARALELCILTATRTAEVLGAQWSEVDFESRMWTIPANRMKAGKEHRVPLSAPALSLLRKMEAVRKHNFIFPGQRPNKGLSGMAMEMAMRRMKVEYTPHGFRSTFRDWVAEKTDFPNEVAEMALAHKVSDKVEAAYRRGDLLEKRRAMADAWAMFVITPPNTTNRSK